MSALASTQTTPLERAANTLFNSGRAIFSLAIIALGVETIVCAHRAIFLYPLPAHPRFHVIPVFPYLPAIPWLAYLFGAILAICGIGLLFKRTLRTSALALGCLFFLCTLILEAPKNASLPGSMGLRTNVFEPVALAALAWLLPGRDATPSWLVRASRYLLALSLIVFGVDHFLALAPIGTLIPGWIPWHVFWIGFFGVAFIAAGVSIALNFLLRWSAACLGLMFMIWVFTIHIPRTLFGLYGGRGPKDPDEWAGVFIVLALWGGSWALARFQSR